MLNISVAPQIKSSAENSVAMINSGSAGLKEPVAEEFGKVLEREVSEATDKQDKNNASSTKEHSSSATSLEETVKDTDRGKDTDTAAIAASIVATTTNGANSFIQNLLSNTSSAYRTDQSLSAVDSVLNPDAMTATPILPLAWLQSTQNALPSQDGEQITGSAIPISNQLLQQRLAQPNLAASSSTFCPIMHGKHWMRQILPLTANFFHFPQR